MSCTGSPRLCPASARPSHDHLLWLLCSVLRAAACFALVWLLCTGFSLHPRPGAPSSAGQPAPTVCLALSLPCWGGLNTPCCRTAYRTGQLFLSLGILARATAWGPRGAVPVPPKRSGARDEMSNMTRASASSSLSLPFRGRKLCFQAVLVIECTDSWDHPDHLTHPHTSPEFKA